MQICSVRDCDSPVLSRGWCNKHYIRWSRHGDPEYRRPKVIESQCTIEDCERGQYSRGWCTLHYDRWFSNGDPLEVQKRQGSDLAVRFAQYVTVTDTHDCIEWAEMTDRDGYGLFSLGNRQRRAHRVSYELHVGPIPIGLVVRHKCDNPPCVNPRHLEIGTGADNTSDRVARGRSARGEGGRAKLTEAQVLEIREISSDLNYREIAVKFHISRSTVWQIVRRKTWRHI